MYTRSESPTKEIPKHNTRNRKTMSIGVQGRKEANQMKEYETQRKVGKEKEREGNKVERKWAATDDD